MKETQQKSSMDNHGTDSTWRDKNAHCAVYKWRKPSTRGETGQDTDNLAKTFKVQIRIMQKLPDSD